jgi:hypothetical protein
MVAQESSEDAAVILHPLPHGILFLDVNNSDHSTQEVPTY